MIVESQLCAWWHTAICNGRLSVFSLGTDGTAAQVQIFAQVDAAVNAVGELCASLSARPSAEPSEIDDMSLDGSEADGDAPATSTISQQVITQWKLGLDYQCTIMYRVAPAY